MKKRIIYLALFAGVVMFNLQINSSIYSKGVISLKSIYAKAGSGTEVVCDPLDCQPDQGSCIDCTNCTFSEDETEQSASGDKCTQ